MTLNDIMFYLFAGSILTFSLLTVISRRILRSAVYLLFVLVSTAGIYFMLNYNFLAAVQLTVYAGGIIVLIIFSILLTSHVSEKAVVAPVRQQIFRLAVAAGAVLTILTITKFAFTPTTSPAIEANVTNVGRALVSYNRDGFALPFEVISILLLAAMVGAIVLAKKEKHLEVPGNQPNTNPDNSTKS